MLTAATVVRRRVVRLPGKTVPMGAYATTDVVHPFAGDEHTGTSCVACFGWQDDPRHVFRMPRVWST